MDGGSDDCHFSIFEIKTIRSWPLLISLMISWEANNDGEIIFVNAKFHEGLFGILLQVRHAIDSCNSLFYSQFFARMAATILTFSRVVTAKNIDASWIPSLSMAMEEASPKMVITSRWVEAYSNTSWLVSMMTISWLFDESSFARWNPIPPARLWLSSMYILNQKFNAFALGKLNLQYFTKLLKS